MRRTAYTCRKRAALRAGRSGGLSGGFGSDSAGEEATGGCTALGKRKFYRKRNREIYIYLTQVRNDRG